MGYSRLLHFVDRNTRHGIKFLMIVILENDKSVNDLLVLASRKAVVKIIVFFSEYIKTNFNIILVYCRTESV